MLAVVQQTVDQLDLALLDLGRERFHLFDDGGRIVGVVAPHHLQRERVARDAEIRRRIDRFLDDVVDAVFVGRAPRVFVAVRDQQDDRNVTPPRKHVGRFEERQAAVRDAVVDDQHVDLLLGIDFDGFFRVGEKAQTDARDRLEDALMMP